MCEHTQCSNYTQTISQITFIHILQMLQEIVCGIRYSFNILLTKLFLHCVCYLQAECSYFAKTCDLPWHH